MATETLHFTIGENGGLLLTQIAQEKLLYDFNIEKAILVIEESLVGCPRELTLQIINGDVVILVDVDKQEFIVTQFMEGVHDKIGYERLNLTDFLIRKLEDIESTGEDFKKAIDDMMYKMKYRTIGKRFNYSQILDFLSGNDKAILDEFLFDDEVYELESLIKAVKMYMEKSMKIMGMVDMVLKNKELGKAFEIKLPLSVERDSRDMLATVINKFNNMLAENYTEINADEQAVNNYIEAAQEIDETLSKGIEPVDIMDNYSAGWLAPNGDYYALNGEIANMLHIQISSALQEKGIVPNEDNVNPDAWLEQNGWVKIHGSNVQFAGCLNHRIGKKNVDLTDTQIKKIYEYCALCHNGVVKAGWRMEQVSAVRFKDMAYGNLEGLYQKYFEY
jgi:hypothetical protein